MDRNVLLGFVVEAVINDVKPPRRKPLGQPGGLGTVPVKQQAVGEFVTLVFQVGRTTALRSSESQTTTNRPPARGSLAI